MDQTPRVRRIEGIGDATQQPDGPGRVEWSVGLEDRLKIASLDVTHGDVQGAGFLAGVVDRNDIRVVERRGGATFDEEARAKARVDGQLWMEHLERDRATKPLVGREPHDTHPPAAEQPLDPIGTDAVTLSWLAHGRR